MNDSDKLDKALKLLYSIVVTCPHSVDEATVPKAGIEAAPSQVVFEYSVGYLLMKEAKELLGINSTNEDYIPHSIRSKYED